eukprot:3756228-Pyramimonas_sp.AAC.1
MQEIAKASNIMTSRYVYKWNFAKTEKGEMGRTIRLRLVLRVDVEAFDLATFSGTARRSSQSLLASAAACKKQRVISSLDVNMAFLKGLTYQELAEATGERNVWCVLVCRLDRPQCSGLSQDSSTTTSQSTAYSKPGTGTKDAPRASSHKQEDHRRIWSPTRVLRRGVRDEQQFDRAAP